MVGSDWILEKFMQSPLGKKLTEERDRERQRGRQQLCDQLSAVHKHVADQAPVLAERADKAAAAAERARVAFETARQAAGQARADLAGVSIERDYATNKLERELRETADPALAEFLEDSTGSRSAHVVTTTPWRVRSLCGPGTRLSVSFVPGLRPFSSSPSTQTWRHCSRSCERPPPLR